MRYLNLPDKIRPFLVRLWQQVREPHREFPELKEYIAVCSGITFGEDDSHPSYRSAIDAVGSVSCCLKGVDTRSVDYFVQAPECVRNVVDRQIILDEELLGQSDPLGPDEIAELNDKVAVHPSMIREIDRECSQIRFLQESTQLDEPAIEYLLRIS